MNIKKIPFSLYSQAENYSLAIELLGLIATLPQHLPLVHLVAQLLKDICTEHEKLFGQKGENVFVSKVVTVNKVTML